MPHMAEEPIKKQKKKRVEIEEAGNGYVITLVEEGQQYSRTPYVAQDMDEALAQVKEILSGGNPKEKEADETEEKKEY